jgi:hypothetical protein
MRASRAAPRTPAKQPQASRCSPCPRRSRDRESPSPRCTPSSRDRPTTPDERRTRPAKARETEARPYASPLRWGIRKRPVLPPWERSILPRSGWGHGGCDNISSWQTDMRRVDPLSIAPPASARATTSAIMWSGSLATFEKRASASGRTTHWTAFLMDCPPSRWLVLTTSRPRRIRLGSCSPRLCMPPPVTSSTTH